MALQFSVFGPRAVVGAWGDGDNGPISGSAYIFDAVGDIWTQTTKLIASDGAAQDRFANDVALSNDVVLIGAHFDDDGVANSGSAYIFEYNGLSWSESSKLNPNDVSTSARFGFSVSISGNTALIGANADIDNGFLSGSAYLF